MVGAGAVVTHNAPPHSKLAGNPARIIGYVDATPEAPAAKLVEDIRDATAHVASPQGEATVYRLPRTEDLRGSLSFGEVHRQVPFEVKRYFLVFDVASEHIRGEHAHRTLHQFLVCVAGTVPRGHRRRHQPARSGARFTSEGCLYSAHGVGHPVQIHAGCGAVGSGVGILRRLRIIFATMAISWRFAGSRVDNPTAH